MSLLKYTYNAEGKKINGYLKAQQSGDFFEIQERIANSLFQQHQVIRAEVRFYWIDEDGDEIDIVTQSDYDIFVEKSNDRLHLLVAPKWASSEKKPAAEPKSKTASQAQQVPRTAADATDDASNNIHTNVECDSCLMAPIVGFRYKCIQCPNFDLCQNCEAKHVHSDHMMVRMPNYNCPYVVDAWVTNGACGRKAARKYEKRCKNGDVSARPPFGFNLATASAGGEAEKSKDGGEQSDRHHGRKHARRHARNTFFSNFYNIMHDLAEGGGAAAVATETAVSAGTETDKATTTTGTTTSADEKADPEAKIAAAFAAAQSASEVAVKTADIAANVAYETALSAATTSAAAATSEAAKSSKEATNEPSHEKVDATTSPPRPSISAAPSLQDFVQLLDPKLLRSGMDILNNFNDMFAKMLDPMDGAEGGDSAPASCPFASDLRKNSTVSTQSASSKKSNNSLNSNLSSDSSTSTNAKDKSEKKGTEEKLQHTDSGLLDVCDLGSDSENDSVSESFIKIKSPTKENTAEEAAPSTSTPAPQSQSSTPTQSLNKSNVMDFAQLSADLKAHIAQENNQDQEAPEVAVEMRAVPVFNAPTAAEESPIAEPKKPEDKRAVPVYHADQRINNAVHAMMSMGFSNEGAWLTQLLENVNGNIPDALDLISTTQRSYTR